MELFNYFEFKSLVQARYELFTTRDAEYPIPTPTRIDGRCDSCQRDVYLEVEARSYSEPFYSQDGMPTFCVFLTQCPRCSRRAFEHFILLTRYAPPPTGRTGTSVTVHDFFKIFSIPVTETRYELADIPPEQSFLKRTVQEAAYCLDGGNFTSSAIMYRRALQILAKNVLGAEGRDLYRQLEWLKTNSNTLGVNLTNVFHDNSDLIRKVGNQGAHPDDDPDLHDFSKEDAHALHDLFIVLVHEVFVLPAKMQAIKDELMARRKMN